MRRNALLGIALASLLAAPPALAINVGGTWEGSITCKRLGMNGEATTEKARDAVLRIVQVGAGFDAQIESTAGTLEYRGATIDDAADADRRGGTVLVACGADTLPLDGDVNEIIQLKVKVDAVKGTGTVSGTSVQEHGMLGISACKFKFKRISTASAAKFPTCM